MSRLRSLTVTPAAFCGDQKAPYIRSLGVSLADQLPSLLHPTVSCNKFLLHFNGVPLPLLSSFTLDGTTNANISHISCRTLCLRLSAADERHFLRRWTHSLLTQPPSHISQLSLSDCRVSRVDDERARHVFPSPDDTDVSFSALSHLVYLDAIHGLTLADLTYLLTPSSPPVFVAQLTHLALRVQWTYRDEAAVLLPSLPSTYSSLTHVHVSIEATSGKPRVVRCRTAQSWMRQFGQ